MAPTYVDGMAWPDAASMQTPLGEVALDVGALETLRGVTANREAHAEEHSLEVQLPFLQAHEARNESRGL